MSNNVVVDIPLHITSSYYMKQYEFEREILAGLERTSLPDLDEIHNKFFIFDCSKTYWHDLGALLWFISLLNRLKRQGNELQIILPEPIDRKSERVWDFLIRWRFFETLSACVDDPANLLRPEQVHHMKRDSKYSLSWGIDESGRQILMHTLNMLEMTTTLRDDFEQYEESELDRFLKKYNDKIVISALSKLCGWDPKITKSFVHRVIKEGIQNTFLHSGGTFSNISMLIDAKNLTLVVCDNGIGIPRVLREAFSKSDSHKTLVKSSDVDLIKYFTEPQLVIDSRWIKYSVQRGTTSKKDRAGLGLYYLKSLVLEQGGELRIRSGRACVDFTSSGEKANDDMIDSPGTMLRIRTDLKK